ncbi:helix-turn-helix domain-containing protein [Actinacidiphila acididurans]|uniref:helix-turn-helix domain-containing protein n=1 Tax=Actinacidiphila acididurans TaxID=2784346 RepID=UPI001F2404EB|nr:helix-turn-helix transcriptional regulator [Actinacidiphila acididurans]
MTTTTATTTEARTWSVTTTSGLTVRDQLPAWADNDPSRDDVRPEHLHAALADVVLEADAGGLVLPVVHGQDPAEQAAVLAVTLTCKPFGQQGEPRVPVAEVQLVEDFWLKGLDPQGITDFGHRLHVLGHLLIHQVAPALQAARADWSRHHPTHRPDAAGTAAEVAATARVRSAPRTLHQEPQAVQWAREKAGLTKRALAEKVGISEQLMGEIESGWRSATPINLARIAEALNCPVVALERKRTDTATAPQN